MFPGCLSCCCLSLSVFNSHAVLGDSFLKYMEALKPFLLHSIQNIAEVEVSWLCCADTVCFTIRLSAVQVCLAGLGLVGDLCRNLSKQIEPYFPELMSAMFAVLTVSVLLHNTWQWSDGGLSISQTQEAHRSVKPPILSALGDMALAIGPSFSAALPNVLQVLEQAAQLQVDKDNYDMIDYCNELRDGCLEAYTGIIQGLKSADNHIPGQRPVLDDLHIDH